MTRTASINRSIAGSLIMMTAVLTAKADWAEYQVYTVPAN